MKPHHALLVSTLLLGNRPAPSGGVAETPETRALRLVEEGRQTFRHETFGDQSFWGGALRLHEAIAGVSNGGVGPGVSPATALAVGLKIDAERLGPLRLQRLATGQVDLDNPRVTVGLIRAGAVVGVRGFFDSSGDIDSIGITCALCHSDVDDSVLPGVGRRLDGWPNRDLDVGTIMSLAPDLSVFEGLLNLPAATIRSVLQSWGPGRFDAHLLLDGQAFRPDGASASVLIPPAFGQGGVNLSTHTGWGGTSYWNAFVANLEMGGQGSFFDPRLKDPAKFPIAAMNGFDDVRDDPDLITPRLEALQFYQLSLPVPEPPAGSFDVAAAQRGEALFNGAAGCSTCHVPPIFTEPGWNLHAASEIGIDDFQARRSPVEGYRTAPLRGLFTRSKGGFYHDGRFATLSDVVAHYQATFSLGLGVQEQADLVEYLSSL